MQLKDFDTFCPKALAGIGELPTKRRARSIPIRMARKRRGEQVERWPALAGETGAEELSRNGLV